MNLLQSSTDCLVRTITYMLDKEEFIILVAGMCLLGVVGILYRLLGVSE